MDREHVKLIKVESTHNNLRTNDMVGFCYDLPKVGQSFSIFGEGLKFGTRVISTSPVREVKADDSGMTFKTLNSVYRLEFLEDDKGTEENKTGNT